MVGMARSMMKARGMPAKFWGEAVTTAVFILNRAPTKALTGKTSFEAWSGGQGSETSGLETSGLEARGVRLVVWRLSGSLSSAGDPVGPQAFCI